jgi:hypothetical protein
MAEEQYIINRRAKRDKYIQEKIKENKVKLKQRIENLRTQNTISSILKSQQSNNNIDKNINELIDKIKGDNPEFTQENVRTKLQQDYNIRDKKIKIPEFVSEIEADDIFDKISKQSISTIYKKARATSDPALKERLMQEYRNQNKAIRLAKIAAAAVVGAPQAPLAPQAPVGAPQAPLLGTPQAPLLGAPPKGVLTRAKAKITKTPLNLSLKNLLRKIKPGSAPSPPSSPSPSPPPSPPVARLITPPIGLPQAPPVAKPFFNITKKSASVQPAVILTKEEKQAIADVEKKIKADELLNAKTTAKEEKARLKAEKEANRQPYFGKKKTGKGFKKINPKYLYSYNTIN